MLIWQTATDFDDEVYFNTISGARSGRLLTANEEAVMRELYHNARGKYKETAKSIFAGDASESNWNAESNRDADLKWDAEHGTAYANAFSNAMRELNGHGQCKLREACRMETEAPPGMSCQPSWSPLGDLAIIPRIVTAKRLIQSIKSRGPKSSFDPGYDFHIIRPIEASESSTVPQIDSLVATTQVSTGGGASRTICLPVDMPVFGSLEMRQFE